MRNIELIIISNNLEKYKDKKLPQKISYAITKNNMLIMQEQKVYIEEFNKIIKEYDEYIIKDTDGQMKLNTNGIPMVKAEVEKEFDIDLFTISEECFNYDDTIGKYDVLSPSEIMFLQSFLCKTEKESDK